MDQSEASTDKAGRGWGDEGGVVRKRNWLTELVHPNKSLSDTVVCHATHNLLCRRPNRAVP